MTHVVKCGESQSILFAENLIESGIVLSHSDSSASRDSNSFSFPVDRIVVDLLRPFCNCSELTARMAFPEFRHSLDRAMKPASKDGFNGLVLRSGCDLQ